MTRGNEFIVPVGIELDEAMVKRLQSVIEKELGGLYATLAKQTLAYNQAVADGRREIALEIEMTKKKIAALERQEVALRNNAKAQQEYQKFTKETAAVTRATGLIMQDLAFGFVAIQNNIPALIDALNRLKLKQLEVGAITQAQYNRFMMLVSAFNAIQAPLTFLMVTNPKLMSDAFSKLNEVITGTSEKLTKLAQFRLKDALGETAAQDVRKLRDEIAGLNAELATLRRITVGEQNESARKEVEKIRYLLTRPNEVAYALAQIIAPFSRTDLKRYRRAYESNIQLIERGINEFIGKDLQDEAVQKQIEKFLETGTTDPTVTSKAGGLRRGLNALLNIPFLFEGGANEQEQAMFREMVESERKIRFDRAVEQAKIEANAQKELLRIEQERARVSEIGLEQYPARLAAIRRETKEKERQLEIEIELLNAQKKAATDLGDKKLADALGQEIARRQGFFQIYKDTQAAQEREAYKDRAIQLLKRRQSLEDVLFTISRQDGVVRQGMEAKAYELETEGLNIRRERLQLEERIALLRRMGRSDAAAELETERAALSLRQANYELNLKLYSIEKERIEYEQKKERERETEQERRVELNRSASDILGKAQFNRKAKESQARALASRMGRELTPAQQQLIRKLEVEGLKAEREAIAKIRDAELAKLAEMQDKFQEEFSKPPTRPMYSEADYKARQAEYKATEAEIQAQVERISKLSEEYNKLTDQIVANSARIDSALQDVTSTFMQFAQTAIMQTSQLIGRKIEMVVSGEEALMRKELELSERRIAMQRRQNEKREKELVKSYRRQMSMTDELLSTQQITESEALRRRAEAQKEFQEQMEALQLQKEELALREKELERRRSETLANNILMNITNLAAEAVMQVVARKASMLDPFSGLALILGAATLISSVQGALKGLIMRTPEGGRGGGGASVVTSQPFGISSGGVSGGGGMQPSFQRENRPNVVVIRDERPQNLQVLLKSKDLNLVGEAEERQRSSLSA